MRKTSRSRSKTRAARRKSSNGKVKAGGFGRRCLCLYWLKRSQRKADQGFSLSSEATAEDRSGRMAELSPSSATVGRGQPPCQHQSMNAVALCAAAVNRRCHGLFLHREKTDSQEFRQACECLACTLSAGDADQFLRPIFAGRRTTGQSQNPRPSGGVPIDLSHREPLRQCAARFCELPIGRP